MNTNTIQNNWSDIKAQIKTKWSKFTDTDLESLQGNLDKMTSQIQKTYGIAKEQAEKEFNDFKKAIRVETGLPVAKPSPSVAVQADAMASEGGGTVEKT